jgi:hypothetical protein
MSDDLAPRVAVIGDSTKWTRWLQDRAGHHPQAFVIDVPPLSAARGQDVAEAVLEGLGKDRRLRVAKRTVETLAAAWLSVTDRTDAFVADATGLPERVLDDVIALLEGFGIRPWLVVPWGEHHDADERARTADALVDRYGGELLGPDDFVLAWPDAEREEPAPAPEWPIVPRVDGHFFRPAVRDLLEPDDAAMVDRYFVEAVKSFRTALAAVTGKTKSRQFEKTLRARMHEAVTDEEVVTIVRAAQVAGSLTQFHVAVNPVRLYGACTVLPRRGHVVRDDWWVKLARYPDPDVPAIATLHIAEFDLNDILQLDTDSVTAGEAGTVTVTGASGTTGTFAGPPAEFIRAAVAWRLFSAGAGPLFSTHRAASISNVRLGHLARAPMEIGIRHTGTKAYRTEQTATRWLANYGIEIHRNTKARNR